MKRSICSSRSFLPELGALAAALLLATASPSSAAQQVWKNTAGNTDFNAGTSWLSGMAPGAGDVAAFSSAKIVNPNLSASVSLSALYFSGTGASGYTLTRSSSQTLTLTGYATSIGAETGDANAVAIGAENTSGTNTISVPITLAPASGSTSTIFQATGGTLVINGAISGSGIGLTKTGGGELDLTGNSTTANTYSGLTTVSAGTLGLGKAASTNAFGGDLLINGGTVIYSASNNNQIRDAAKVTLTSGGFTVGGVTETIGSTLTPASGFEMTGGTLTIASNSTSLRIANSFLVADGSILFTAGGVLRADTDFNFSGGLIDFATNAANAILQLNGPTGTGISYSASGTSTAQITSTGGGGKVVLNAGSTNTFNIADSPTVATEMNIAAKIDGTSLAVLQKTGAGVLVLSGANTYKGATNVDGGTLLVNGSLHADSTVTVTNSGSVVGGTGTINGAVIINPAAKIRGGTGASASGTLTVNNNLTLNSGGIIELALGGTSTAHSTLAHTGSGAINFASNQSFSFIDLGAVAGTTYQDIITGVPNSGSTVGWNITNPGWTGSFVYDGFGHIDFTLSSVPEPSTWVAAVLAALAVGYMQRKRVAQAWKRAVATAAK